jgi:hypothetical protein
MEEAKKVGIMMVTVITRAKDNCVAYEKREHNALPKRGPKPKYPQKGKKIQVIDLFKSKADQFTKATIKMYGKLKEVSYLSIDLLWGKELYQELRFVLVLIDGEKNIFVCTSLLTSPEKIISLYCFRFKIEVFFKAFKQSVAGFGYHFWTTFLPELKRRDPAKAADEKLKEKGSSSKKVRESVVNTYNATEGFVLFCCIAIGILQLVALTFTSEINAAPVRWLRTRTNYVPSEESTAVALRDKLCRVYRTCPNLGIVQIIRQKLQPKTLDLEDVA